MRQPQQQHRQQAGASINTHQLLQPKLSNTEEGRRNLWLLALDKNLRYLFTSKVVDNMTAPIETYADQIASTLRNEPPYEPHYYVLAHGAPHLDERCDGCLDDGDEFLRAAAPLRPYELLGRLAFDGDLCWSTPSPRPFLNTTGRGRGSTNSSHPGSRSGCRPPA